MKDGKESAKKEAELEYQRCVNSKLLTFDKYPDYSKYCDPKSYNKAKCSEFLKQATEKAKEECLDEYKENREKFAKKEEYFCYGIYNTCKEMEKEQCKKPTADKFPKTLNVTISRTCYWETNDSNIPTINSDSYNIQGVVELKDIGESAKFVEGIRKGMIPTPKDLEQSGSKGIYDFIGGFAGSLLYQYADEQTGCKLVTMDTPPLPGFFVVGNQPLFSTQMFGKLKASEVGECEGEGYFVWNFSGGLGPMVRISEKYEIPVRLINFPQDEEP